MQLSFPGGSADKVCSLQSIDGIFKSWQRQAFCKKYIILNNGVSKGLAKKKKNLKQTPSSSNTSG